MRSRENNEKLWERKVLREICAQQGRPQREGGERRTEEGTSNMICGGVKKIEEVGAIERMDEGRTVKRTPPTHRC